MPVYCNRPPCCSSPVCVRTHLYLDMTTRSRIHVTFSIPHELLVRVPAQGHRSQSHGTPARPPEPQSPVRCGIPGPMSSTEPRCLPILARFGKGLLER